MGARTFGPGELPRGPHGWIEAGVLLGDGVRLVFTNRLGGVSEPPFHTMNLGMKVGDDPSKVTENRERLARYLGRDSGDFAFLEQVHGKRVVELGPGRSLDPVAWKRLRASGYAHHRADGAACPRPGPVLCVLTADCLPLALYHPRGAGALLHAGWRGTIYNIAGHGVRSLCKMVKAEPGEVSAVIGPGIGPCCYRVDRERARLFREVFGNSQGVVIEGRDGTFLDLRTANLVNLQKAGVRPERIAVLDVCTCCREEYFSHRREGRTGRQGAFLLLY